MLVPIRSTYAHPHRSAGYFQTLMFHFQTEYEGQVKKYMEVLENTDAIIAAGGDGTLLEVGQL